MSEDTIVNLDLYSDQAGRKLVDSTGSPLTLAPLTLADTLRCTLRNLVQNEAGQWTEEDMPVRSLRASIGPVRAAPTTGTFKFRRTYLDEGGATVTALSDDIDATGAAADFVLACATVFGQPVAECSLEAAGCWLFRLTDSSQLLGVDVPSNRLDPEGMVRLRSFQRFGGEWWQEVRLIQYPLAFNENGFDRVLPPQPSMRRIRAGFAETPDQPAQNEIQALTISPDFVGTIALRWNLRVTSILGIEATPDVIASALNAMFDDSQTVRFQVTNPENDNAYIEFVGDLGGAPQNMIEVDVVTFAPGVITFDIPLDRAGMVAALRKVTPLASILEVEVELGDPTTPEVPGRIVTLFRAPVSIECEEIFAELSTIPVIPWSRPGAARNYIPFTPDQIIVGQQSYAAVFGDGASLEFDFAHNLGTQNIANFCVRENKLGGRILGLGEYSIYVTDNNSVVVFLGYVADVNSLAIVIMAAGPASVFQAHTHTMAQIVGLLDALAALSARIAVIEALLPSLTLTQDASSAPPFQIILPPFSELYPTPEGGMDAEAAVIKPATIPGKKKLLPAIHDAEIASLALPLGDPADFSDVVFVNDSGADVEGFSGGAVVADGGFVGCDGRVWYAVNRSGETNSFYPANFERELFSIPIDADMWRPGQQFSVEFDLDLVALKANTSAQYVVMIVAGAAGAQSDPAPVDPLNLSDITWVSTPILKKRVVITSLRVKHHFGARFTRSLTDTLSADKLLYSQWSASPGSAPAAASFVLRGYLAEFDTANPVTNPTGFIYRALSNGSATII